MEQSDIYRKLESMNEHIAKLRESSARTETLLTSLLDLKEEVEELTRQQNQWRGAMIIISGIFSIATSVACRMYFK